MTSGLSSVYIAQGARVADSYYKGKQGGAWSLVRDCGNHSSRMWGAARALRVWSGVEWSVCVMEVAC